MGGQVLVSFPAHRRRMSLLPAVTGSSCARAAPHCSFHSPAEPDAERFVAPLLQPSPLTASLVAIRCTCTELAGVLWPWHHSSALGSDADDRFFRTALPKVHGRPR